MNELMLMGSASGCGLEEFLKAVKGTTAQPLRSSIAAINDYVHNNNQHPRAFVWSASVEQILTKIAKCKEAFDGLH